MRCWACSQEAVDIKPLLGRFPGGPADKVSPDPLDLDGVQPAGGVKDGTGRPPPRPGLWTFLRRGAGRRGEVWVRSWRSVQEVREHGIRD